MNGIEPSLTFRPRLGYSRKNRASEDALTDLADATERLRRFLDQTRREWHTAHGVPATESLIAFNTDFNTFITAEVLAHILRNYGGTVTSRFTDAAAELTVAVPFREATTTISFTHVADGTGADNAVTSVGANAATVEPYFTELFAIWLNDALILWEVRN